MSQHPAKPWFFNWLPVLFSWLVLSGCQPTLLVVPDLALPGDPQDPSIVSGRLDNGFSYHLRSTNTSERRDRIDVRLIVKVGSLAEQEHERGYAHLLEHLVFRGTERYSAESIEALLESAGLAWGVDVNATTHYAATVYRFSLTDSEADLLPEILALLTDFLDAVRFQPQTLELEKRIVEAEWRFRYGHRNFVVNPVVSAALAGARHSQRPPIGDLSSVRRATVQTLESFWRRHYRPSNAALVVTGNIVPWKLEEKVRENFARVPQEPDTADSALQSYLVREGNKSEFQATSGDNRVANIPYINPDLVLPQVGVSFISKVKAMDTLESVRESFREELLYKAVTHLLRYRLSVTPHCSSASAHNSLLETGQSIHTLDVTIADEDYITCLQSVSLALGSILRSGFSAVEYALVQKSFRTIAIDRAESYRSSSPRSMAETLTQRVVYGTPALSASTLEAVHLEMIEAMDADQFNKLLSGIEESYKIVYTATASKAGKLPSREQMVEATESPDPTVLVASRPERQVLYGELKPDQLLEQLKDVSAARQAGNVVVENNYFEWKLSNGARAILLRDERYDYVAMTAISAGGYLLEDNILARAARELPRFVGATGAGGYLRKSLQRLRSERDLFTSVFVDPSRHGIAAYSVPADLPLLMELVSAYFDDPVIVEPVSSSILRKLNSRASRPVIGVEESFWQQYYGRASQLGETSVMNTEHLKQVQKLLFRSPSDFTFVFVGNADPDTVARELVRIERHAKAAADTIGNPLSATDRVVDSVVTESRQTSNRLSVGLFHSCRVSLLQREVAEYYLQLLSSVIERRVRYDLRENRGLTYNIDARLLADSPGSGVRFHQIDFSVHPQDVTQARVLVNSVLNAIGRFGVTERELELAVKREEKRQRDLSHNYVELARELAIEALYGASLQYRDIVAPSVGTINSIASCFSSDNTTFIVDNEWDNESNDQPATLR